MPRFQYSLQACLGPGEGRNLGVMVWSDNTLHYFAVRGEEPHARKMNERIADTLAQGQPIRDFVDYFLDRGGGYHLSMARPEVIEAESPLEAARGAGARWHLDIVVPAPEPVRVEPVVVQELLEATKDGADLVIRGTSYHATDLAFAMGFGALDSVVVFGYLPFPYSFSPTAQGRFFVNALESTGDGWVVHGRDARQLELVELRVEVRTVSDPAVKVAMARFRDGLGRDERDLIVERLDRLTDPMLV